MACAICNRSEGEMIWHDKTLRVVLLNHPDYKGYCRVELIAHQKEMTDLDEALQFNIMRCVFKPEKINLASLGNKTPHVHWHIIPRFKEDPHFPNSHWGEKLREGSHQTISAQEKTELITLINQSLS
jgi:diadenosine tetraphosphate (Ap4A) HIT family hydrolase